MIDNKKDPNNESKRNNFTYPLIVGLLLLIFSGFITPMILKKCSYFSDSETQKPSSKIESLTNTSPKEGIKYESGHVHSEEISSTDTTALIPQKPPVDTDLLPSKKENKILSLDFKETQENTNLIYDGTAKLTLKEDKSLYGSIEYELVSVPPRYRDREILQGNPKGTELVRGFYDRNGNYTFKGYKIVNDYTGAYAIDDYIITLSSIDNSFYGTTKGNNDGSTKVEGTYTISTE